MKLTTNKHKIIIIIYILFTNAFANAQALICDTIQIWPEVKIFLCSEQHFLKFKNSDGHGGYFWTLLDTTNKSNIVIKRSTWNLIPPKNAKDIIATKIDACDTTIIFGTYLNINTSATNHFKQKIYPSFEISYWDVPISLKSTYDSIINSLSIFQAKNTIDTIRYDASGDTTYVQRNASDTHFRAYYGNYVKETDQPDKIYNEEGYIALHGDSVSYHFFERDYLGSVRAVFDLYGNLEQTNDYNVTGIPSSRHLGNADVHKHTGKEFQGFNDLAWYDNNARYYDPILGRFTTQDPLAEKYPWLSPYNHCANNPLKFVDRDGRDYYNIDFDTGVVSFMKETNDKMDRLFSMNKGIVDNNNYIDLTKGIIGNAQTDNIIIRTDAGNVIESKISVYSSTTDNSELFKFVSLNSDVEWSQVKTLDNTTGNHKFYLGTSSMSYISQYNVITPFMITEANHCHSNGSLVVSSGDISVAKEISLKYPNATFSIYSSIDFTNKVFTPNTEPDMLPELIVTP